MTTAPALVRHHGAWTRQPRKSAEQVELERLRRRNAQLEADLAKTKLASEC